MTGLGSMGQSIGGAIGAQLAYPGRSGRAIVGDGCFAMNAFEIRHRGRREPPDPRLCLQRPEARHGRGRPQHGLRPQAVVPDQPPRRLPRRARPRRRHAARRDVAQLAAAADLVATTPGPVVIDVAIDCDIHLPKLDRVAAMKNRPVSTAFGVS